MARILSIIIAAFMLFSAAAAAGADESAIKAEISRSILEASPWRSGEAVVDDVELQSYKGDAAFNAVAVKTPGRGIRSAGKVSVYVTLMQGENEVRSFWATARIHVYTDAVVALNNLRVNQKVEKDDVRLERVEIDGASGAVESVEAVEGMVVKRPVSAGAIVKREYLKPETIVRRGDRIVVTAESGLVRIKSMCTAAEDGSKGALVGAKTSSGKEIRGRITGPGEMTVDF